MNRVLGKHRSDQIAIACDVGGTFTDLIGGNNDGLQGVDRVVLKGSGLRLRTREHGPKPANGSGQGSLPIRSVSSA